MPAPRSAGLRLLLPPEPALALLHYPFTEGDQILDADPRESRKAKRPHLWHCLHLPGHPTGGEACNAALPGTMGVCAGGRGPGGRHLVYLAGWCLRHSRQQKTKALISLTPGERVPQPMGCCSSKNASGCKEPGPQARMSRQETQSCVTSRQRAARAAKSVSCALLG